MQVHQTYDPGTADAERRFILEDVPWWAYVALRDALEDTGTRMTYLEGRLELMSPSEMHEEETKLISRLLEAYADAMDLDLRGFRSTTYRHEAARRGLEPDECYALGAKAKDAVPQIAIEVVVSSPLLDKLDVYAGLGVPEVWIWRNSRRSFEVYVLAAGKYERRETSALLPKLDLALMASFVRPGESHVALVKTFRAALKG
jgi:Uma2 family endonuclease